MRCLSGAADLSLAFYPGGGATACPAAGPSPSLACDKEILLALRDTLRGSNHERLDNWQPETPVGLFRGVTVRGDPPRVVAVRLGGHGMGEPNPLVGTIPPALGRLFWLEDLTLQYHRFTGPIPPALGQLARLESLDISGNRLTGPHSPRTGPTGPVGVSAPFTQSVDGTHSPELGQLAQLESLDISGNALEGCLPAVWAAPPSPSLVWRFPSLPFCPD